MTRQQQLKQRGKCPFVRLIGGIGYVCDRNKCYSHRDIRRNRNVKCEGCNDMEKYLKVDF